MARRAGITIAIALAVAGALAAPGVARAQDGADAAEAKGRAVALQLEGRYDEATAVYDRLIADAERRADAPAVAEGRWLRALCRQQAGDYATALDGFVAVARDHADTPWGPLAATEAERLAPHRADGFAALGARDRALRAVYVAEPDLAEIAAAREALARALDASGGAPPGDLRLELTALAGECELRLERWGDAAASFERAAALATATQRPAFAAKASLASRYVLRRRLGVAGIAAALALALLPWAIARRAPARRGGATPPPSRALAIAAAAWLALAGLGAIAARIAGTHEDEAYPIDHRHVALLCAAIAPAIALTIAFGWAIGRREVGPRAGAIATAAYGVAATIAAVAVFLWLADLFPALGLSGQAIPH